MKEYDLYVPSIVEGKHLPANKLASLEIRLIKKFGGLTYFPQRNKGFWKVGAATFQDEVDTALKKKKASLLVFEADAVLKRVQKLGDLFAPVLFLKQKLPSLENLKL